MSLIVVALCLLVAVLLPLSFPTGGGPTEADKAITDWIHSTFSTSACHALVTPSDGPVVIGALVFGVVVLLWRKRWRDATFLAIAPELAVGVNEVLLKHLWHRHLHDYLAYPSGHTVQFVAVATGFVLVTRSVRLRLLEVAAIGLLLACAATGMIGLGYHYPTDILGGACTAIAIVVLLGRISRGIGRVRTSGQH